MSRFRRECHACREGVGAMTDGARIQDTAQREWRGSCWIEAGAWLGGRSCADSWLCSFSTSIEEKGGGDDPGEEMEVTVGLAKMS